MIRGYGRDKNKGYELSEVSLMFDKKDLREIKAFIDLCVEEMDGGSFTGENGGHRHFSFFKEKFDIKECDFIIMLDHKGNKNV